MRTHLRRALVCLGLSAGLAIAGWTAPLAMRAADVKSGRAGQATPSKPAAPATTPAPTSKPAPAAAPGPTVKPAPKRATAPKAPPATAPAPVVKPAPAKTPAPSKTPAPATEPAAAPSAAPTTTPGPAKSGTPAETKVPETPALAPGQYLLRYRFRAGEELRWAVEHLAMVRTTINGSTQVAETDSKSVKVWKVTSVTADGQATFVHSVAKLEMRQRLTGRQEVSYNSETDREPPLGFQDAARCVGVPLTEVTVDPRGTILRRTEKLERPGFQPTQMLVPLPEEPVTVGHVWNFPYEVEARDRDCHVKQIKVRDQMTLVDVRGGVAQIRIVTQVLSPVNDPAIEVQLVQGTSDGTLELELASGRILARKSDLDKHVHGFQGEASSLHYQTRFTEKLTAGEASVASKPTAGPKPPSYTPPAPAPAAPGRSATRK